MIIKRILLVILGYLIAFVLAIGIGFFNIYRNTGEEIAASDGNLYYQNILISPAQVDGNEMLIFRQQDSDRAFMILYKDALEIYGNISEDEQLNYSQGEVVYNITVSNNEHYFRSSLIVPDNIFMSPQSITSDFDMAIASSRIFIKKDNQALVVNKKDGVYYSDNGRGYIYDSASKNWEIYNEQK